MAMHSSSAATSGRLNATCGSGRVLSRAAQESLEVPSRGLLLILIAGLILAIGAVGAARRDDERTTPATTQPATTAPVAPQAGGTEAGVVTATLPADRVVRAKVGDQVELRVTSAAPDILKIPELAVDAAVGPGISGPVRFTAIKAGKFEARLELAQSVVGRVSVTDGSTSG
jgi:hypothetical protein